MMNSKHLLHTPKVLLLTSILLGPAWLAPASATAAETQFSKSRFRQLLDGDVQLAPVGQRAGLHLTFKSPSNSSDAFSAGYADNQGSNSGVRLSIKMPWK
jgi:hypothetical protein